MFKQLIQKKVPQLIGLDIGTRFVKAVILEQKGEQYHVQAIACEPISGNAFAEREIKDFDALSTALRKVKLALKTKSKQAVIAVAGSSVISKVVFMDPDQSDFELESQIEIEADSLIPYPLDEVYLDFEEQGPSLNHTGKVDVLLSAAHKDLVDSRITLIREIPFEPKVVDIEGYALGNALNLFYPRQGDEPLCCINLGASLLQMCVLKNGQVQYSKEHNFGMDVLVQDLAVIHNIERGEAEKQLLNKQLPENWRTDTYPIFLANLQQQISRALQVYISTTHAPRPASLVISGGGAALANLCDDLSNELGIEVVLFNPFANMSHNDKIPAERLAALAPSLAIAAGLASRSFDQWHM